MPRMSDSMTILQPVPIPACAPLERLSGFGGLAVGVLDVELSTEVEMEVVVEVGALLLLWLELLVLLGILLAFLAADFIAIKPLLELPLLSACE